MKMGKMKLNLTRAGRVIYSKAEIGKITKNMDGFSRGVLRNLRKVKNGFIIVNRL